MRNRTLDMVKAICAYAVVLLHVHFPGSAGIIANVLARFAVPVFFMVSGYFCFRGDDTEFIRTGKKIRHFVPNKEELNDQHNYFSCQSSKRGTAGGEARDKNTV